MTELGTWRETKSLSSLLALTIFGGVNLEVGRDVFVYYNNGDTSSILGKKDAKGPPNVWNCSI